VALELHEAVDAKDIEAVAIDTYWVAERYVDRKNPLWHPATRETADHSLPYCVVAGLLDGEVTEASFSARRLRDSRIAALLERTTIREVPEYSRAFPQEWPCRIEVTLRGGRKQAAEARYFRGHAKRPLSDEEIVRKFRFLAEKPLGRTRADAVLKMAWNADKLKNVRDLLRLLKFGRRGR
jgi:2-methylcitrate dehydratase